MTDYDSIRPGMSLDEARSAAREILKHLPGPSTNLDVQEVADDLADKNTDERLQKKPDAAERAKADLAAKEKDAYLNEIMARPAGTPMTKDEGAALASAVLSALKSDGFRI